MLTYYNDIDPYCCEWLSNLISAKHLPGGVIDPRSIKEISADDLSPNEKARWCLFAREIDY